MGLFDKRKTKSDDFDSPVENIDLSAPHDAEAEPAMAAVGAAPSAVSAAPSALDSEEPRRAPDPVEEDFDPPAYGIDDAIQLMRALPQDNVELVVQVVKRTLESTRVKVKTIIDDASRKQSDIEGRISVLKKEIGDYEQEIATRKEEIDKLETDHSETTTVKERLVLAEKLGSNEKKSGDNKGADKPPARPMSSTGAPPHQAAKPPPPTGSGAPGLPGPTGAQGQPAGKSTTIVAKK